MITNLQQFYFEQVNDLYSAETQLLGILPQMAEDATCPELREAFKNHLQETRTHCERLNRIRSHQGISDQTEDCEAMRGLIAETKKYLAQTAPGGLRDAVLIAAGNRIEHYEIAGYGATKAFASCLGFSEDAMLLAETLREEGAADLAITKIATGGLFHAGVNEAAAHPELEHA